MTQQTQPTIALVGNPNCGKTTLFNALTGSKQRVGNWPGVTIARKSGAYQFDAQRIEVIDLPGTYSLDVVDREISLDEMIARDYVHSGDADLIVNIVDAAHLERNLYLTTQLAEMGVPLLVVLNMGDVAAAKGMRIDTQQLAMQLGCPVLPIIATQGQGIAELRAAILQAIKKPTHATISVTYTAALETAITALIDHIPTEHDITPRWLTVRLLEGDDLAQKIVGTECAKQAASLSEEFADDLDILVADAHYSLANRIANTVVTFTARIRRDYSDRIDRVVLNRILGIPIFLFMMYLMFMFTIKIGGAFIDFFDQATATLLVDGVATWLGGIGTAEWLILLLAKGIGGGLQTVATFIPIIGFLYLFLSVLEDSGYMARAAFVMDRFMRWVGLPGKSFVPLIVGFGCNVPAIMATRTLEHRRDRLMTIAMAPFMSCGARLPVYVLFAAAFFPHNAQNVVFSLYLIGIVAAVITGLMLKNSLLTGEATPFIMELPPYHRPTIRGVLTHTWERLKSFIFKAGRIIVPMVLVLNILNAVGNDGSFGNEDSDKSILASIGRSLTPAFGPMGMSAENWPAAVGIFTGILAKEAVVGTLNASYTALALQDAQEQGVDSAADEPFELTSSLAAAFSTIGQNLGEAFGDWADPLGLQIGDLSDQEAVATTQEVSRGTFGAMVARFDGSAGAFAYLLFILLYFPCTAAIAAVHQESGTRWSLFVAAWTSGLAYGLSTLSYQIATYANHPSQSLAWVSGVMALFAAAFIAMRRYGQQQTLLPLAVTPSIKEPS